MEGELICALLFGEAETREKAEQIAKRYKNCPYISFMATRENQLFATFFLPKSKIVDRICGEKAEGDP